MVKLTATLPRDAGLNHEQYGPNAATSLRLPCTSTPIAVFTCSGVSASVHGSPDSTDAGRGLATFGAPANGNVVADDEEPGALALVGVGFVAGVPPEHPVTSSATQPNAAIPAIRLPTRKSPLIRTGLSNGFFVLIFGIFRHTQSFM